MSYLDTLLKGKTGGRYISRKLVRDPKTGKMRWGDYKYAEDDKPKKKKATQEGASSAGRGGGGGEG